MISRTPVAGIVGALAAMRDRVSSEQMLASLGDIPTLVMVGEVDSVTPPDSARAMTRLIPGARLAVISGAGHLPPIEKPEKVNDQLREFLSSIA
jgi:3-oxoadipate enol-lactonase